VTCHGSVDVSFRPIEREPYNDTIEFITTQGNFYIGVVATLPEFGVKMQKYLDFGFSTVKEESTKTFTLRNVGEVDAPFELLSGLFSLLSTRACAHIHTRPLPPPPPLSHTHTLTLSHALGPPRLFPCPLPSLSFSRIRARAHSHGYTRRGTLPARHC